MAGGWQEAQVQPRSSPQGRGTSAEAVDRARDERVHMASSAEGAEEDGQPLAEGTGMSDGTDYVRQDAMRLSDLLLLSICEVETDPEKLFEAVKAWRRDRETFQRTEKSND